MIKRVKISDYEFKSAFGTIVVPQVILGVSESGRRSIPEDELSRLSRLAALNFLKKNYIKAVEQSDYILPATIVRAIMVFLHVNQSEFAKLIGCQKAKVSKILANDQEISKSQTLLALERLATELARPGAIRKILGHHDEQVLAPDDEITKQLNLIRFRAA
jgi:transcriptional regulator with XRE-family HTH domain